MLCDVGALQPLLAVVAAEAGLVVDAAAANHLLSDVHRLACAQRTRSDGDGGDGDDGGDADSDGDDGKSSVTR